MNEILDNIRTEADLCRNETADDIANLLDKAADEIIRLSNLLDIHRKNWQPIETYDTLKKNQKLRFSYTKQRL